MQETYLKLGLLRAVQYQSAAFSLPIFVLKLH